MPRLLPFALLAGLLAVWPVPAPVQAGTLERLVMPGEVIRGHAKYENDCEECHQPFRKDKQRTKCLSCHKLVQADVRKKTGLHGRHPDVARFDCKHCHTDHKGRDADIVHLDPEVFDHDLTDYPLKGSHRRTPCAKCHARDAKHRDAPRACNACHQRVDPHRGHLGPKCATCHTEKSWRETRFEHTKTRFLLEGKHAKTPCADCHPGGSYAQPTPAACYGCHMVNDVHRGRYGDKCQTCHTSTGWKQTRFNHDATKYPLLGKHREVACDLCHHGKIYEEKLTGKDCLACHRPDDVHKGRYGTKCEECHTDAGWRKPTFDHEKTRYPLRGKHRAAPCDACHPGSLRGELPGTECGSCHQLDDRHKGRYGRKCSTCHNQEGWGKPRFDHEQTRYPLRGEHRKVRCDACHLWPSYSRALPTECYGCHQPRDVHGGRFGPGCRTCHDERGWKPALFDHDKTQYPLRDKHREVRCARCHVGAPGTRLGTACVDCHEREDVHKGQEGRNCERCHKERGWASEVLFDHDLTRLPLIGLHAAVPCEACHPVGSYKNTPLRCVDCHLKADTHRQSLGSDCGACHTPNGWALWQFDHTTQSRFPLAGAHESLECKACHRRPAGPKVRLDSSCSSCHLRDDVHHGRFGSSCERCHSAKSFKELTQIH